MNKQGGFNLLLIEDLPNIPRQGKGKEINGRKQLEAGEKSSQYLEMLKTNPQYRGEIGMTPEEQIMHAIKHLEQTNQVIDDWKGRGSLSYQLGAYFTADDLIPYAVWHRDGRQACLLKWSPGASADSSFFGARTAVRI